MKTGFTKEYILKHKGCYEDVFLHQTNSTKRPKGIVKNCIGAVIFDYLDRWYMDGSPAEQNYGERTWPFSPDNLFHEEYWGITSMGDGKHNIFKRI